MRTVREVLGWTHVSGDFVIGNFAAYRSDGSTRLYQFNCLVSVSKGNIVSGHQQ